MYNYLSKYTIEPNSRVPLFMVRHFKSIIYMQYIPHVKDIVPEHSIMINRRCILHRFKQQQNAPLGDLFIFNVISSSNFQNIVSKCGRMNNSATSFSKFSEQFQFQTSFHIAAECINKRPRFQFFLSSSNVQSIVSNCDRLMHH